MIYLNNNNEFLTTYNFTYQNNHYETTDNKLKKIYFHAAITFS